MNLTDFIYTAYISFALFFMGLVLAYLKKTHLSNVLIIIGIVFLGTYIARLWGHLNRPPIRTLGETRLAYSFFLSAVGFILYLRWKYLWFLTYSLLIACLFILINLIHLENFDKTLMPALHSPWFVPHVVVYIFSYALLGASAIVGIWGLIQYYRSNNDLKILSMADNIVYIGFSFLTLGLIFGALWAKEAWGHYWTWDPKETWAFLTWACYLLYIHLRFQHTTKHIAALWMLSLAFVVLLCAWFGINYLPAAQTSVHVYSR